MTIMANLRAVCGWVEAVLRAAKAQLAVTIADVLRLGLAVSLTALLAACGGSDDSNPGGQNPAAAPLPPGGTTASGDALAGVPGSRARDAIVSIDIDDRYDDREISTTANGERILRTKLLIALRPAATVGEVNALVARLQGRLTASTAGLGSLVLRIPDPGSLAALDALVASAEAERFVWMVRRAIFPELKALPANIDPADALNIATVSHHLATGAGAAWNARRAAQNMPSVVIWDVFGGGAPNADLNYFYEGDPAKDFGTGQPDDHGYHVAGIVAGFHGGSNDPRQQVSGMMPERIRLSVVDVAGTDPLQDEQRLLQHLLQRMQALPGTVILNASYGYHCTTPVTCVDEARVRKEGAWWIEAVRDLGLEPRVLVVVAAGNINDVDARDARYDWHMTAAALLPGLIGADNSELPPLNNTLAIENAVERGDPTEGAHCLRFSSFVNGHLSAVGTQVWSFTGAQGGADYLSGTSMATPQVSGLAAYLLAIRPELTPQDLIAILRATAVPLPVPGGDGCSNWQTPAPFIQAYGAVLALDRPNASIVRRTILDIDGSGAFNEADIAAFIAAFETAQGAVDFSAADLNNDGRTGGETTRPFDLDVDRIIEDVGVIALIANENRRFNERALSDIAILCYYAYSSLYVGGAAAREQHLQPYRQQGKCGAESPFAVSASLQSRMIAGVPAQLTVDVSDRNGPVSGASITISAVGGSAAGGSTGANGRLDSTASIAADAPVLTLTIQASVNGEVVGEIVRQAQRALPAQVNMYRGPTTWTNVSGISNVTGGTPLGPPGNTVTSAVNPSRTLTWTWDTGVPFGQFGYTPSKMHRFAAQGSDVTLELFFTSTGEYPTDMDLKLTSASSFWLLHWPSGQVDSGPPTVIASDLEFPGVPPTGNPGSVRLLPTGVYELRINRGPIDIEVLFTKPPD